MNRTKEQWAAARGIPQAAICDEAQQDIAELHARIEGLEAEIAAQTERADFAWRNTNTIAKSHQELMAERDALMEKHNALHISARKDRDERDALRAQIEVISNKYESIKQLQQLKAIERGQPK